jgi:hypothetical protein
MSAVQSRQRQYCAAMMALSNQKEARMECKMAALGFIKLDCLSDRPKIPPRDVPIPPSAYSFVWLDSGVTRASREAFPRRDSVFTPRAHVNCFPRPAQEYRRVGALHIDQATTALPCF